MTVDDISGTDLEIAGVERDEWTLQDAAAREYIETATEAVVSLVRSTLGPRGMEKLIKTHDSHTEPETVLTADAGEILSAVQRGDGFNHPVAAVFVDIVDSMQRAVGDGTATTLVLAGELVSRGLDCVEQGIHPGTVVVGYAMAANRAGEVLDGLARECTAADRALIEAVAATSMTSDLNPSTRRRNAEMVGETVAGLATASDDGFLDADDVRVFASTEIAPAVHRGLLLKRPPTELETDEQAYDEFDATTAAPRTNATVVLFDDEIDFEETATPLGMTAGQKQTTTGVTFRTADAARQYTDDLGERRRTFAAELTDRGVDVFVSTAEVSDALAGVLETTGIDVVDRATYPKEDIYRLARATGGRVVSRPEDVMAGVLGTAGRYEERLIAGEKWCLFADCPGGVFSILLHADTPTVAAKRERLVANAVGVASWAVSDCQVLPGAGAPAAAVAADLRGYARSVSSREQLAVGAFADALDGIVATLARNAGCDPLESVTTLRAAHRNADTLVPLGFSPDADGPINAYEAGIVEPRRVFSQAVETARTAAEHLLTIDGVLFPNVDFEEFSPRIEHD